MSPTHPALGFAFDVRAFDAVQAAINAHIEARGPIDMLISGAASDFAAAAVMSPNMFKAATDVDTLGTFHVMRAAYAALAKPGIDMITRVLAIGWGHEGVRVNCGSPGPIPGTQGMERLAPTPEAKAALTRAILLGRMGTVDDLADVCLFLASAVARSVSGAIIPPMAAGRRGAVWAG